MQRARTGEGYVYYRTRARGEDHTIYEHQLGALLAGYSVSEIWDEDNEVHHVDPVKLWNEPENVEVVDAEDHNEIHGGHCEGRQPLQVATDGGEPVDEEESR